MKRKYQKLRDSARGEECTLLIQPYCNNNPETVVLCHIPNSINSGTGLKPPDWFAVYACSGCHDIIDYRNPAHNLSRADMEEIKSMALFRTWSRMIEEGLIKI